jgi:hypothetical protein
MRTGNGKTGEQRAEWLFKKLGWRMFRHQQAFRYLGGGKVVAQKGTGGKADYTGYVLVSGKFVAAEVKEASGDAMPCSRLSIEQRKFMDSLPVGSAWIVITWMDTPGLKTTHHRYQDKGSYRK